MADARIDKIYEDLYTGRGKENPPLTTRVALIEDAVESLSRNATKGLWLMAGNLAAVCSAIVLWLLHVKP